MKGKLIFIISNEEWGNVWLSKHHYALELAKDNEVYFVDPPGSWSPGNLFSSGLRTETISKGLTRVSYRNNFPVLNGLFLPLNDRINSSRLQELAGGREAIFWQFDPFRFITIPALKNAFRIYHVTDLFRHIKTDREVAANADLVVTVSPKYIDYYKEVNSNVLHVPHGNSDSEEAADPLQVSELKNKYGKFVLFSGSISRHVNMDMLKQLSAKLPGDTRLVITGPLFLHNATEEGAFKELCRAKNITYAGVVKSREVAGFAAASDVCLIAYNFIPADGSINRSPLKTLTYLRQLKPVVSTIDSEIPALEGKAIYRANDADNFIDLTLKALEGKLKVDEDAVNSYLDGVSYSRLIQKIEERLNGR